MLDLIFVYCITYVFYRFGMYIGRVFGVSTGDSEVLILTGDYAKQAAKLLDARTLLVDPEGGRHERRLLTSTLAFALWVYVPLTLKDQVGWTAWASSTLWVLALVWVGVVPLMLGVMYAITQRLKRTALRLDLAESIEAVEELYPERKSEEVFFTVKLTDGKAFLASAARRDFDRVRSNLET